MTDVAHLLGNYMGFRISGQELGTKAKNIFVIISQYSGYKCTILGILRVSGYVFKDQIIVCTK